jgi:tRNA (guanine37-N1)-methyltransferase
MVTLREALKNKLSQRDLSHLRASFDVVGDVAVIEIPYELENKAKIIATTLFKLLKNVNVVACKLGKHYGKYRRQKLKVLAGEKRVTTAHVESGCRFKLDVETCYFSPRLSSERLRAAKLIKKGEKVFVACSGVAPFPIVMSKHSKAKNIVALELNPAAHKFAVENVKLNKCENVDVHKGDVKLSNKFVKGPFDRIFLPAPKEGSLLIPGVLKVAKKSGCFLHVYDFSPEGDYDGVEQRVRSVCNKAGWSCKILRTVKCGQHAPRVYRVRIDCFVKKKY